MKRLLIVSAVFLFLVSCGKKEVKQVTYESKITTEAIAVSETIKEAYLKRDLPTIEKNTTKEGYRELLGAIKQFDKAELTLEPKWATMEDSGISLKVAWSGTWIVKGQTTEERGLAIFIFEGSPLRLSRILRANPFRQPE